MDISDKLWQELSLLDFSNVELLQIHGYLCIALAQPQTKDISSRDSMIRVLSKILDHLHGIELISDQDIELLKNQESIFEIHHPKIGIII